MALDESVLSDLLAAVVFGADRYERTDTRRETLAVPVLEAIALAEDEGTSLLQVEAIAGHELDARRVSVELKRLSQAGYVGGKIEGPA